jgi:ferredoxin-NADP reductase
MAHSIKLIGAREVADGTMEFTFERPADFNYIAGQSVDLTLVNPPETDTEGNMRAFTLASAPHEEHLRITTRMRDTAFKRNLKNMQPGTEVSIEGPFGSFFLHENVKRPAVMLAGGIGVTPFHSIAHDAAMRGLPHTQVLFYANRRPEDAAYLAELAQLHDAHDNFTFVPTMTGMEKSGEEWRGEKGYVTAEMLAKYVPADSMPIYYLAGPQKMVLAMRNLLTDSGISGDDIRFEEFSGY